MPNSAVPADADDPLPYVVPDVPRFLSGRSRDLVRSGTVKVLPMAFGIVLLYLGSVSACLVQIDVSFLVLSMPTLVVSMFCIVHAIRGRMHVSRRYRDAFIHGTPIAAWVLNANEDLTSETWTESFEWRFRVGDHSYTGGAYVDRTRASWSIADLMKREKVVILYDPADPNYHALYAG